MTTTKIAVKRRNTNNLQSYSSKKYLHLNNKTLIKTHKSYSIHSSPPKNHKTSSSVDYYYKAAKITHNTLNFWNNNLTKKTNKSSNLKNSTLKFNNPKTKYLNKMNKRKSNIYKIWPLWVVKIINCLVICWNKGRKISKRLIIIRVKFRNWKRRFNK